VKRKLFSLISGIQVSPVPGKKIITAQEFSELQNLDELLILIKQEAEDYRLQVTKECEEIKEQGYRHGYEEGFNAWSEQLAAFEQKLQDIYQETQKMIVPLALKAAKKIVGREIQLSENSIVDIVLAQLRSVSQHKKIIIYVNKKELEVLEQNKSRLRELFENLESLSIRSRDDIEMGGCVIETEIGIINAQLEQRWKMLEKAFASLMKEKPKTTHE